MRRLSDSLQMEDKMRYFGSSLASGVTSAVSLMSKKPDRKGGRLYGHITEFQPILNEFDKLRRTFQGSKLISLPSVVVIGDQSHGKSALLESISGVDLPKGKGMKTRLPLELQLRRLPDSEQEEYAIISISTGNLDASQSLHKKAEQAAAAASQKKRNRQMQREQEQKQQQMNMASTMESAGDSPPLPPPDFDTPQEPPMMQDNDSFDDLEPVLQQLPGGGSTYVKRIRIEDIAKSVDSITDQFAGGSKSVKDCPIFLTVYRKNMVDLTLIDLPGLIRNVANANEDDKPGVIRDMTTRYIRSNETIILNVLSCMVDPETSESLALSHKVDPARERTLLVFTMVDMHSDYGLYDKFECIQNDFRFPSNQIYLVRNRKEEENQSGVDLSLVQQREDDYFADSGKYDLDRIPSQCKGSKLLTSRLAQMQKQKIFESLPGIQTKLMERERQLLAEQEAMGAVLQTPNEFLMEFQKLMSKLYGYLEKTIRGSVMDQLRRGSMAENVEVEQKMGESRYDNCICSEAMTYFEDYYKGIEKMMKQNDFLNKEFFGEIKNEEKKVRGFDALPGAIHPLIATKIIRRLAARLLKPSLALLDRVHKLMVDRCSFIIRQIFTEYPTLCRSMLVAFETKLAKMRNDTAALVTQMIDWERNRPFTLNPQYMIYVKQMEDILIKNRHRAVGDKNIHPSLVRVAGRKGVSEGMNGVYLLQPQLVDKKPHYAQIDSNWVIYYNAKKAQWVISYDRTKTTYYTAVVESTAENPADMSADIQRAGVNVWNYREKKWEVDKNMRVDALSYASVESVNADSDVLNGLNFENVMSLADGEDRVIGEAIKIAAYWKILVKRVVDHVPMCVQFNMIDGGSKTQPDITDAVINSVQQQEKLEEKLQTLMAGDPHKRKRIEGISDELLKLQEGKLILDKIDKMMAI